ncbi:MAG TPA: ATP-dependent DNA helicase RecQ [Cytophagaceae bacterium]
MSEAQKILQQYFGYNSFRPLQEDIINSIVSKKDTLALLPTGGGKSLCYQVPVMMMDGLGLVITPLIALMKDQLQALKSKNISAVGIYSGLSYREIDIALDRCIYGGVKFLYVSPERLQTELFLERVKRMPINLIAVDEAHCISQWGYDFRPAYLKISLLREIIKAPVLALTATATPEVTADIKEKLAFKDSLSFYSSFSRVNISYSCFKVEDKSKKILEILLKVPGSGIIYVRSRNRCKEFADFLNKNGIKADFYHAGLKDEDRSIKQQLWLKGSSRIMVATNAFGMGIDKADVRTVIHLDLPDSPETYFQESGRGGRDGRKSYAVILYTPADITRLQKKVTDDFPPADLIKKVYQGLANFLNIASGAGQNETYPLDVEEFCKIYSLPLRQTYSALKRLAEHEFILLNEYFSNPSKVWIKVGHHALYNYQIENEQHDSLIKTILRIYGGETLSGFININEKQLAKYLNSDPSKVSQQLAFLEKSGILAYDKAVEGPQITFLTPRYDAAFLPLDLKKMEFLKNNSTMKASFIVNYISQQLLCRNLFLLKYFHEYNTDDCGICDVCNSKNKPLDFEIANLLEKVRSALEAIPLNVEELHQITAIKKEHLIVILRELLDLQQITVGIDGKIYLI